MQLASIIASIATAVGALLLAWQVWVARHALKAQTRTSELQVFTTMNMKFLELISEFKEHINEPRISEADLDPVERRAMDRWFYLASLEYVLHKEGVISASLGDHWIKGIRSAAKKNVFAERWNSTASKFTLDEDFRKFFEMESKKSQ